MVFQDRREYDFFLLLIHISREASISALHTIVWVDYLFVILELLLAVAWHHGI